ncbi:MAG: hypothetical protein WAW39_18115 [Prosthecobacter sp.]|uniref:hypothetical protein n=1 Tax=Prosthecobacter sp. TaxID=1965333 RepID=UPI003BAE3A1D
MKPLPYFFFAATLACCGSASAQTGSPPAKEVKTTTVETSVIPNGIVFYRNKTYFIRNERAVLVDAFLIPVGQVLTPDGRLVVLPTDFVNDISPTVREGLFTINGQAYLIRNGLMTKVSAVLVPEGQVLTADGRLQPLPADFSGFVQDRAAGGSGLPTPR